MQRSSIQSPASAVLSNFDIFAATGAENKAIVEQFNATADSGGHITVQLTQGSAGDSVISGLELYTGSSAPSTPLNLLAIAGDGQVSVSWNAVNGATSYSVKRATVSGGPYTTVGSSTTASYTDSGLVNGTTYFYVVTAVNASGESAASHEVSGIPTTGNAPVYRINCGGGADAPYTADEFYSGGSASGTGNAIDTSGVSNPAPTSAYQDFRFNSVTYTLPGLTAGSSYTVRLHFADPWDSSVGQRVFDILINGVTVQPSFDIIAAAGGANKAVVEQFNATADTSGNVTVQLSGSQPIINGLELYTGSSSPSVPINLMGFAGNNQVSLVWNSVGGATSYNVKRATVSGGPYTTISSPTSAAYTDTGLVNGTAYFYVVTAVNGSGESAPSNEASATPVGGSAVYQINCGGGAVSPYVADEFFSGGDTLTTGNTIDTSGVSNPAPMGVYQSCRHGYYGNTFTYTLPSLTPGAQYTVRLHFTETQYSSIGQRRFNVSINGTAVLPNFDIFAAAGAANKAVVEQFNATADTSGNVTVQLTQGSADYSVISGLELITGSSAPSTPISLLAIAGNAQVALTWNAVNGAASYNVKRATVSGGPYTTISSPTSAAYTDSGLTNGTTYFYVVTAVNTSGESAPSNEVSAVPTTGNAPVYQINCGGGAVSPYVADEFFSGGDAPATGNTIDTSGVSNPAPMAVYQTCRHGYYGNTVTYTLPGLTSGTVYTVRMHFAETQYSFSNQRKFNVSINGAMVLPNFDIFAAAGAANKAVVEQFNATADTSGDVTIQLTQGSADYSVISGLELYTGSSAPSTPINLLAIAGNGEVALSWNVVNGAVSYNVKRATVSGGPYTTISSPTSATFTDTGLVNGTRYFYVVSAVNANGESSPSNEVSATPAAGSAVLYQINCGGGAVSPYAADEFFSGGDILSTANTIDTSGVSNPAPMAVYQTCRHGYYGNTVTYTIPGLTFGSPYTVRMHFVETQYTFSGLRCFNVSVNGTTVLSNFDIFAAAGAVNKAVVEQFNATADVSGDITVQLTQGSADTSVISGLEISGGQSVLSCPFNLHAVASHGSVNLAWTGFPAATGYNVYRATTSGGPYTLVTTTPLTVCTYLDSSLINGTTYFYVVTAVNGVGESSYSNEASATPNSLNAEVYKINCGGPGVADWSSDEFFAGGISMGIDSPQILSGVTDPAPAAVYTTSRSGTATYTLPYLIPNSQYAVRLHFCNPFHPAGMDVQNVSINGTAVLTDFDVNAETLTPGQVNIQQFNAEADSDGKLTIAFTNLIGTTEVCGIEVFTDTTDSLPPPVLQNLQAWRGNTQVGLSWLPEVGATAYNVKRSLVSGGPYTSIATNLVDPSYSDATTANYYYVVTATNTSGEGPNSNEAYPVPPFVLSANPTSLDIGHPGSAFSGIVASSTIGFTGTILYSTSAIPSNVNCVLYPVSSLLLPSTIIGSPVSTSTMVQFCANRSASTGTQPITVTGTCGDYTATAVVNLTIH